MKRLMQEIRIAVLATLILGVLVCGVYPALVWGIARGLFPGQADGSLVIRHGRVLGSELIGQGFSSPRYFHPRPSSAGTGYDPMSSGGSNLGPLSRKLVETVERCASAYRETNGLSPGASVPADAVTASASGLDPHISLENALLQAPRVAKARNVGEAWVRRKIEAHAEGRGLGFLGQPRVNVLMLNLDLDGSI